MKRIVRMLAIVLASLLGLLVLEPVGFAQQPKNGIERFYVFYCGDIALNDMGRFSPGYSGPGALSDISLPFWKYHLGPAGASRLRQPPKPVIEEPAAASIGGALGNHLVERIVPVIRHQGMDWNKPCPRSARRSYLFEPNGIRYLLNTGRGNGLKQVACLIVVVKRVMIFRRTVGNREGLMPVGIHTLGEIPLLKVAGEGVGVIPEQ